MRKKYVKYSIFFVVIILGVIGAVLLSNLKISDNVLSSLNYVETDKTSYKVYYDNPYYEDYDYLDEGKTYIRDNVSDVKVNFDYILNFSDNVSGNYTYTIDRELYVYEPGNVSNDYWSNKYDKIEGTQSFQQTKTVDVINDYDVKYQDYVDDYLDYKSENVISTDAKLIVTYTIKYSGKYDGLDDFNGTKTIKIEIPLSDVTFTISKSNDLTTEMQSFSTKEDNSSKRTMIRVISIGLWLFVIFAGVLFIIVYTHDVKSESTYNRKLRKILNTYDSIIVNVDKLAPLEDVAIAKVSSFEELLDAQNEVRLPINFKEDKRRHMAKFILLRNNFAWVYVLKEGEDDEK